MATKPKTGALRIRGPMSDLQRVTRWTDAILDGRRTFGDVRRRVGREKNSDEFKAWKDYNGPTVRKGGDIRRIRLGRDAIEDRIRQIYGSRGVSLGSEMVIPKERKSIGQKPLPTRALVRIERAWDRAVDPYETTPGERKEQQKKKAQQKKKSQQKNKGGGKRKGPSGGKRPSSMVVKVKRGDTLSGIAQRELGDADAWRKLYRQNRKRIGDDPNLITPGMRLLLPGIRASNKVKVRSKRN